jgi:hypothetical protein
LTLTIPSVVKEQNVEVKKPQSPKIIISELYFEEKI